MDRWRHRRRAAGTAVVFALAWLVAKPALACHESDGVPRKVICFATLHAIVATGVFLPTDIVFARRAQPLPPAWAWSEIVFGGAVTIAGAGVGLAMVPAKSPEPIDDALWGIGVALMGAAALSHGVLALTSPGRAPPATVSVLPVSGGAVAVLALRP
jgi:hypothetical protein